MLKVILLIAQFVIALAVVAGILFMEPKGSGLGAISGSAHVFHARKTKDIILEKITLIFSILFVISSLALAIFKI